MVQRQQACQGRKWCTTARATLQLQARARHLCPSEARRKALPSISGVEPVCWKPASFASFAQSPEAVPQPLTGQSIAGAAEGGSKSCSPTPTLAEPQLCSVPSGDAVLAVAMPALACRGKHLFWIFNPGGEHAQTFGTHFWPGQEVVVLGGLWGVPLAGQA